MRNYRSHSSLLQIPNRLFYGDTLLAAAEQTALLPPRWDPLAATAGERGAPAAGADEQPNGVAEVKAQRAAPLIYLLYLSKPCVYLPNQMTSVELQNHRRLS